MLTGDQRTPLDLTFRLFDVPVRVSPWFWLLAAFLGQYWLQKDIIYFLAWVVCVFVSIMVHEFGHALTARWLGSSRVSVLLHGFGGLAFHDHLTARWRRIAIILAGPGAGFLLAALLLAVGRVSSPASWPSPVLAMMYGSLLAINIVWGLFNLLPVYPLDGGQFTAEVFSWASPNYGRIVAAGLSLFVAGGLVVLSLLEYLRVMPNPTGFSLGFLGMVMFALMAFDSYQRLQHEMSMRRRWTDDRLPWEDR